MKEKKKKGLKQDTDEAYGTGPTSINPIVINEITNDLRSFTQSMANNVGLSI